MNKTKLLSIFFILFISIISINATNIYLYDNDNTMPGINHNSSKWSDIDNAFDNNENTNASYISGGIYGQNWIGRTFTERQVNNIYYNFQFEVSGIIGGSWLNNVYIDYYNGTDWIRDSNYKINVSSVGGTGIYDLSGSININLSVSGIRLYFVLIDQGGTSDINIYLRKLKEEKPINLITNNTYINFNINNPYNDTSNFLQYLYNSNQSTNPTKNDGTLNGYTFNNGTLTNFADTTRINHSSYGKAITCDSIDNYIDLSGVESVISDVDSFTYSGWFYINDLSSTQVLIGGTNGVIRSTISLQATGNLRFGIYNGAWIDGASGTTTTGWHYISATYDGSSSANLYIDGVLQVGSLTPATSGTSGFRIGSGTNNVFYFNGSIDEVRIWNTALNITQINEEMNSPNPVNGEGLVNSLSLNENSGTTAIDTNHIIQGQTIPNQGNKGMAFDGVDDYVEFSDLDIDSSNELTIGFWLNPDDLINNAFLISEWKTGSNGLLIQKVGNDFRYYTDSGIGYHNLLNVITTGWNHYLFITNTTGSYFYKNGIFESTDSTKNSISTSTQPLQIGGQTQYYKGLIDDIRIYNKTLTQIEITLLSNKIFYNTTSIIFNPTFEELDNTKISDRNNALCINCQSYDTEYTNLTEGDYTAWFVDTLNGIENEAYFVIDLTKPILQDGLNTEYNNGYTINLTQYINYSDALSGVSSCIVNFTTTSQTTNCSDESFTISQNGNISYNILLTDNAGNTNYTNGTLFVNPVQYFYFYDTTSSQAITNFEFGGQSYTNFANITVYNDILNIGNNTLLFNKLGYPLQNFTININTTSNINKTFNTSASIITVTIRDKNSLSIINGTNFTIDFIASVGLQTSTTTGVKEVSNSFFQVEDYILVVSSNLYTTESVYFSFNNQELLSLTVYVENKTKTNLGTAKILLVDRFSQPIQGGRVQALQWDSSSSSYVSVSQSLTGSDGKGTLNIILDDKYYIFTGSFDGVAGNSTQQIITTADDGKTITITLSGVSTEVNYLIQNLIYDITESYNNVTNISTVTFEWEDKEGLSQTVCINSYRIVSHNEDLVTESCTTGSTGVFIQAYFINSSFDVRIKGEVKINNELYTLETFRHQEQGSPSQIFSNLGLGVFIIPLLFLASIGIGLLIENIYIGSLLLMISAGLSLYISPTILTGGIVAFLMFMGWIALWAGAKNR